MSDWTKDIINQAKAKITVKRYNGLLESEWDDFVEKRSINGTLLHTRKFYNHNELNKEDDHSIIFYKKNKIIGVIPFTLVINKENSVLISHLRATYGGFIFSVDVGIAEAVIMVEKVIEYARAFDVGEVVIKNPFRIFFSQISDEFDYALWYHGFKIKYRQLEIAIQIDEKSIAQAKYSHGARSGVHKAYKLLTIEESTDFQSFWDLLERSLEEKYNCRPTHNYFEIKELLKNVGTKTIKLFVAKRSGLIIGGILVFLVNGKGLHAQYIAQDSKYQSFRPLNALIDYIISFGHQKGLQYFNLGMANEKNGKVINYGLFSFKESYGGRGVLRETMNLYIT